MTTYNVGSDHSGKGDTQCIDAVASVLEGAGHTVNKLGVTPNLEGSLNTGNKEDIGVFIINGVCLGTIVSCSKMVQGGGCKEVIFGIPKPIMSSPFNVEANLTNPSKKLAIADDDNFSPPDVRAMGGKYTVAELFEQLDGVSYVYGNTCEEVGEKILNGDTGGTGGSTSNSGEGSIMSGWESITDLLKPLDGEAMVVVRGDAVIIKRIYPPEATALWVYEGINVVDDSVKISDYSPEIYNSFTIKWGASFENELDVCFEKHKELFGERRTEVNAVYEVPMDATDSEDSESSGDNESSETDSESNDDGGLFGFVNGFFGGGSDDETQKQLDEAKQQAENGGTGTGDEQQTKEIPITDEAEAYLFALKTVGRERRKDGHKIECKVIGNKRFEVGEWCRVYLPKFNEDCIMFISKVNHESSADNEWLTNLTLVDYPPSLGSGQSNSPKSESSDDDYTPTTEGSSLTENNPDDSSGDDSGDDSDNSGGE